jgi:polyisoprenoid-binding protein YceI
MSVAENAKEQLLASGAWSVDPAHSTVEFSVKHMVIQTVRGRFRDFEGAIVAGEQPSVSGTISVASLETLHEERDPYLRSSDFFDVERYPEISFQAAGMLETGSVVVGNTVELRLDIAAVRVD